MALAAILWGRRKSPSPEPADQELLRAEIDVERVDSGYVDSQPVDSRYLDPHQIDSKPPDLPDGDQQILDQLRAAGSNLNKPHAMEFYIYLPTRESAERVATEIESEGFQVEVKRAPQGAAWLCFVTRRMVPERAKIAAIGKRFNALARRFDGEYDGWLTSIEK
ncbi:MAG TPA: ribonuclease E inhibitor RraB [Blastocatellia bacterium]|nr:ribonuclease E inhibitor RraB [Blastocatellia bacterium]